MQRKEQNVTQNEHRHRSKRHTPSTDSLPQPGVALLCNQPFVRAHNRGARRPVDLQSSAYHIHRIGAQHCKAAGAEAGDAVHRPTPALCRPCGGHAMHTAQQQQAEEVRGMKECWAVCRSTNTEDGAIDQTLHPQTSSINQQNEHICTLSSHAVPSYEAHHTAEEGLNCIVLMPKPR